MRWPLVLLIMCVLAPQVARADTRTTPLGLLMDQAEIVVLGEFTSQPLGESGEAGVVHYQGQFTIERLIKPDERRELDVGGTIRVNAVRFEPGPGDRATELNKGSRAVLFLNRSGGQTAPSYVVSDNWLGIQPANPTLVEALAAQSDEGPRSPAIAGLSAAGRKILERVKPVEIARELLSGDEQAERLYRLDRPQVHAYCPPQPTKYDWLVSFPRRNGDGSLLIAVTNDRQAWQLDPKSLEKVEQLATAEPAKTPVTDAAVPDENQARQSPSGQLAGRWRMFLPEGFEYSMTLSSEKEAGHYRLAPGGFVFGSNYAAEGDYLVSVSRAAEGEGEAAKGAFKWKIHSPYLLTLVEQPTKLSSDYRGAVLVRRSPAAELRLEREKPSGPAAGQAAWVPHTTMEELDRLVEAGQYTSVRQQMLGYQLESVGIVRSVSPSHPDWVLVDLPGKYWGAALRNVHADHGLKPGDKVRFRGMIVSEGYSSLTLWLYESHNVRTYTDANTSLKFHDKQSFQFHPQVPASELKVEPVAAKAAERKQKHVILPVTISNHSRSTIQTTLAHVWHGGLWPPTALYASVTPPDESEPSPFHPVYLWGGSAEEKQPQELSPGGSLDLELQMDWQGTGSVRALPLMDEPGKYTVRLALVFEMDGEPQHVLGPPQLVELAEADNVK